MAKKKKILSNLTIWRRNRKKQNARELETEQEQASEAPETHDNINHENKIS